MIALRWMKLLIYLLRNYAVCPDIDNKDLV